MSAQPPGAPDAPSSPDPGPGGVAGEDFAGAFQRALEGTGWTLSAVAAELTRRGTPVTATTLSYWHQGRRRPGRQRSSDIVRNLEVILGVESGSLLAHVTGALARGRGSRFHPLGDTGDDVAARLGTMLADLGMPDGVGHSVLNLREIITHHAGGGRQRASTFQMMRADESPTGAVWLGQADLNATDGPGLIEDLTVGRVGAYAIDRERRLLAARIDLPTVFQQGESFLMGYTVRHPDCSVPARGHQRWVTRTLREASLTVEFHPAALPVEVESVQSAEMRPEPERAVRRPVALQGAMAQVVALDVAPGSYGLRWRFAGQEWEDPGAHVAATGPLDPAVLAAWRDVDVDARVRSVP